MYGSGFTISGNPGTTQKFTLTNNGQSLQTLFGGQYKYNDQEPVAFTVSAETNHMRVGFGSASAGGAGHVIRANGSGRWSGLAAVQKALLCNSVAGTNAIVQITLEY